MSKFLNATALALLTAAPLMASEIGRPATEDEIAAWDIDVRPDGMGLPEGSGTAAQGEEIFLNRCASCHGDFGEGIDRWPVLSGGEGTLADDTPVKTIGSYWPYLSTVFDYVHRAMPFGEAQSLTDDEVYAVTAYLMNLNFLVDMDFELSKETFLEVPLPNEGGFYMDDRAEVELPKFSVEPCMENCKESVEITMRAAVLDVTPEDAAARKSAEQTAEAQASAETPAVAEDAAAPEPSQEDTNQNAADTDANAASASSVLTGIDLALAADGEKIFRQCKACHMVGEGAKHRVGPHLNGLFGRAAGTHEEFRYSKAMIEAGTNGLVWSAESITPFLQAPRETVKGTKMTFAGLRKPEDIAAVLAYLATFQDLGD